MAWALYLVYFFLSISNDFGFLYKNIIFLAHTHSFECFHCSQRNSFLYFISYNLNAKVKKKYKEINFQCLCYSLNIVQEDPERIFYLNQ